MLLQHFSPVYSGPALVDAKVRDVMRTGVVTCRPETPVRDVAAMMVGYQIHSVVVQEPEEGLPPAGIVSDLDVAAAAASEDIKVTAREIAGTELPTVASDEPLVRAAQIMAEHDVAHLLVTQPGTGRPAGVISTMGVAAVVAAERIDA